MAGLEEATRLAPQDPGARRSAPEQIMLALSETLTAALTQQARSQGLTLNTFIQAAWAILLGRLTGRDDVVFGVTVAGRPPEIAGIESMVGLFINTLPLRVKLPPGKPLLDSAQGAAGQPVQLMAHQHLGLAEIQGLAGLGELFDTLVVFENYPVDRGSLGPTPAVCVSPASSGHDATHYPVSLIGSAGRAAAAAARLSARPVRSRERGGAGGAAGAAAGGGGCGAGAGDRQARHSDAGGAPHHPAGVERHRARGPVRHLPELFAAQVGAHPRRGRGGVRGRAASAMASSMRAPTSWRITCAVSASAPRWWWGCASSARSR